MNDNKPLTDAMVGRAYELARSGEYEYVYQVERRLVAEGYAGVESHISKTPELRNALRVCLKPYRKPGTGSRPR